MLRSPSARRRALEAGQILPMALMLLALMIGFAAIVTDVGFFLQRKEKVQAITDAAALAGAQELPDSRVAAEDAAREWADRNGYDGPPLVIDFECRRGCAPGQYDTIMVSGEMRAPITLMRVLRMVGVGSGDSCWTDDGCPVAADAAAEARTGTSDADVVLIMDRTGSMSEECRDDEDNDGDGDEDEDDANCRDGDPGVNNGVRGDYKEDGSLSDLGRAKEGARAMLEALDPNRQHVALVTLPAGNGPDRNRSCTPDNGTNYWLLVELSDDYQDGSGSLDTGSDLVATLNCLIAGGWTNLGNPIRTARLHLQNNGRPGVQQVIVLLSDGAANQPSGSSPCAFANSEATAAKNAGIEIYAIAYGADDSCDRDSGPLCDVGAGFWRDCTADDLIRAIATDDDHFFDEPPNSDLTAEFEQIAASISTGSRLVE